MPRQVETVSQKNRGRRFKTAPSVNTNLAGYATAFLGASAVMCFAAPFPKKFTSS